MPENRTQPNQTWIVLWDIDVGYSVCCYLLVMSSVPDLGNAWKVLLCFNGTGTQVQILDGSVCFILC